MFCGLVKVGPTSQGCLRAAIRPQCWQASPRGNRPHKHELPVSLGPEVRHEGSGYPQRPEDMGLEHLVPVLKAGLQSETSYIVRRSRANSLVVFDSTEVRVSSIVDHNVHPSVDTNSRLGQPVKLTLA